MIRRKSFCTSLLHLAAVTATGTLALLGAPAQAQTTLTMSNWVPATHPVALALTQWTQEVEKASQGRIKVQVLPKPVASPQGHYNAIRDGMADLSFTVLGYTPGRFPLSELAELPGGGESAEQTSVALQRVAQKYPAVMAEYKEVKALALFNHGPGVIFNMKKEIASVADLQGMKFRVGGGVVNEVSKALQANTTLKPASETYELLSNGVMDGTWLPFEAIATFKLDKLVRHATTYPGGLYSSAFIAMMNRKAYDGLSKADQALIDRLSGEPLARALGRSFDARDREGKALAQAAGIKIITAPPAMVKDVAQRLAPLDQQWLEKARGKGLANAEQALKDYRAEAKK